MPQFIANLPHLIMATLVIAAATILAALNVIPGGDALAVIAGAGGFSLGVGGASASNSVAAPTVSATTNSTGESTVTVAPTQTTLTHPALAALQPANQTPPPPTGNIPPGNE